MPPVTRWNRPSESPGGPRAPGHGERRRRPRWLRFCRLTAKKKWRQIGVAGVLFLLLALLMLCAVAYLEISHKGLNSWDRHGDGAAGPTDEIPSFFEGLVVPPIFLKYAEMHNGVTEDPAKGKYVLYELPGNVTLPHALLGLTSTYFFALMSNRVLLVQWTSTWEAPGPDDIGSSHFASSSAGGSGGAAGANDAGWTGNVTGAGSGSGSGASNSGAVGGGSGGGAGGLGPIGVGGFAPRTSSLEEVFVDPGFYWGWERFAERWTETFGLPAAALAAVAEFDPTAAFEQMVCGDLQGFMPENQFVKVTDASYFAPLLTVNVKGSAAVFAEIPVLEAFAYLSNWLLRPVPSVVAAVRSFTQRYFESNYVIGMEMSLFDGMSDLGTMPITQQQLFFQEASDASYRAQQPLASGGDSGKTGVVLLVVTDDEAALRRRLKNMDRDSLGAAGVIAITGPRSFGTARVLTELQEAWLLGYGDVCIVSPGSAMGVFGHSRTSRAPIVVVDGKTAHQSTSSQPCLADVGLVQHASCFTPGMLSRLSYDPAVPCVGAGARGTSGTGGSGGDGRGGGGGSGGRGGGAQSRRRTQDSRALLSLTGRQYSAA